MRAMSLLLLGLLACDDGASVTDDTDTDTDVPSDTDTEPSTDSDTDADSDTDVSCNGCDIDGMCYADADPNPANGCELCDSSRDATGWSPDDFGLCDDGLDCTRDVCRAGACVPEFLVDCTWPDGSSGQAVNLTPIGGSGQDSEFANDLGGLAFDGTTGRLWVARHGPTSRLWRLDPDGLGGFAIGDDNGTPTAWSVSGDVEAVTLPSPASDPDVVLLLREDGGLLERWRLDDAANPVLERTWDVGATVGASGARGLAFVPDADLIAGGFTDEAGSFATSAGGLGGLVLVGVRAQGAVHALDLSDTSSEYTAVARLLTELPDVAGLEFDASTGLLYVWHDGSVDLLEVTLLSSSDTPSGRALDKVQGWFPPSTPPLVPRNFSGVAIEPFDRCDGGDRSLFVSNDDGVVLALLEFDGFPCVGAP